MLGTHYELGELGELEEGVGNTLRTTKFQNIQHHAASPKGKKKKTTGPLGCMLTRFIGCREFIFGGGSGMISIVRPEKLLPAWTHGGRCWSGYNTLSTSLNFG
jgi:hypothetical protein